MNAAELFLLSRKLMLLPEDALPQAKAGTTVRLVVMGVAYHPGTSISEIAERLGSRQGHVSAFAKLRDLGVVATEIDPTDRRRSLARIMPSAKEQSRPAKTAAVQEVPAPALDETNHAGEVVDTLEFAARRLLPKGLVHLRGEVVSRTAQGR